MHREWTLFFFSQDLGCGGTGSSPDGWIRQCEGDELSVFLPDGNSYWCRICTNADWNTGMTQIHLYTLGLSDFFFFFPQIKPRGNWQTKPRIMSSFVCTSQPICVLEEDVLGLAPLHLSERVSALKTQQHPTVRWMRSLQWFCFHPALH